MRVLWWRGRGGEEEGRGDNNPKAGTDETFKDFIVARDTGSFLRPGTNRTASWETQETPDPCNSCTTSSRTPDR